LSYRDLRDFISQLEQTGELRRISQPVSPVLEMTALCDRVLRTNGPALLFEHPTGHDMPVLANLFGTPERVARAMGVNTLADLRVFGHVLAALKEPEAPNGLKDVLGMGTLLKTLWHMAPKEVRSAPCQEVIWEGTDVDLSRLPVQHCWPGDVAPLITWGLVITQGPHKKRQNLGIYRQQVWSRNQVIMRWLAHRGGRWTFATTAPCTPVNRTPWPWPWGPTRPPCWVPSRPCPTACPNTSLQACCVAHGPRWCPRWACPCGYRRRPKSCWKGTSTPTRPTPAAGHMRWRARMATTQAITTSAPSSRCSPSNG